MYDKRVRQRNTVKQFDCPGTEEQLSADKDPRRLLLLRQWVAEGNGSARAQLRRHGNEDGQSY